MADLGTLFVKVGIEGVTDVQSGFRKVGQSAKQTSDEVGQSTGKMRMSLMELGYALHASYQGFQDFMRMAGSFSGVNIAARFQKIEQSFTNLLGSQTAAKKLIKELEDFGSRTDFNTEQLTGLATQLLNTGSSAQTVTEEIKAMADAIAQAGKGTPELNRLMFNMAQNRGAPKLEMDQIKEFITVGLNLDKIVGGATGKKLGTGQGMKILKGMTGAEAYQTMIRGMQATAGGSAEKMGGTLIGVFVNLQEGIEKIMKPTGEMLIPALALAGKLITGIAAAFYKINEVTGGGAGLIIILHALVRSKQFLIGAALHAASSVRELAASINELSIAAGRNPGFDPNARTSIAPYGGLKNAWRMGGLGGIGRWALGKFGGLKGPLAGLGIDIGGNMLGDMMPPGFLRDILKNIATGVGLGSIGGPKGMLLGGALGAGKTIYDYAFGGAGTKERAAEQTAENTAQMAKTLNDIKYDVFGGGPRVKLGASTTEIEIALARLYNPKMGIA